MKRISTKAARAAAAPARQEWSARLTLDEEMDLFLELDDYHESRFPRERAGKNQVERIVVEPQTSVNSLAHACVGSHGPRAWRDA
jgi:hypothetical protein